MIKQCTAGPQRLHTLSLHWMKSEGTADLAWNRMNLSVSNQESRFKSDLVDWFSIKKTPRRQQTKHNSKLPLQILLCTAVLVSRPGWRVLEQPGLVEVSLPTAWISFKVPPNPKHPVMSETLLAHPGTTGQSQGSRTSKETALSSLLRISVTPCRAQLRRIVQTQETEGLGRHWERLHETSAGHRPLNLLLALREI